MGNSRRTVRIELLGGLRVHSDGRTWQHFQTQRTGALLAYLALHPGRRHPREELVDLLWPDAPLDSGRHRLSQALAWLRARLEPAGVARGAVLLADRPTVALAPDALRTDAAEFEAALRAADRVADPDAQARALQAAVALYAGDLLPGHYDVWALTARQRLLEGFLSALRRLVAHHEAAQAPALALEYARRAVAADPLAEEHHCDLIRLLDADGQPDAALRQYRALERLLAQEMDETPSAAARALAEQVRRARRPTARPQADARPATLPDPLTRFFGRADELRHVVARVQSGDARLVTLIGPGGSGKTRLAVEAARHLADHYAGAVWFVPLADLDDPARIPAALAEALRLPHPSASPLEQIADALAPHPALLVLDNLEHLAAAAAPLIAGLLERLPRLTVIGTSRQRLRLAGESELPVSPLPLPPFADVPLTPERLLASPSAQLFVDRARSARPSFEVTPQNAGDIARLCARLEGIPLAIELCAAWAQTLSLPEMQTRLARRFDLLVSRRASVAPRHRTLRAAVEYSYVQLSPPLRRLFARLSVFRGGWTLAAAQAVCLDGPAGGAPDALAAMTDLRERSLITAEEAGGEMRYQMLETLREYAAEKLTQPEAARRPRAHAAYYLALAEAAEPHLQGAAQAAWLRRLEADHDNLRAALAWAAEARDGADSGLRLVGALGAFWDARGYLEEGQTWLDRLLALPHGADPPARAARARALNVRGHLARNQGGSPAVSAVMQEALWLWRGLGDERGLAAALQTLATLAYSREDCDEAQTYLTEGLHLARKVGDAPLVARALLNLGNIALEEGQWDRAWALYAESLGLYRAEGARSRAAYVLNNLGLVARYRGDLAAAHDLLQESLAVCRELADRPGTAEALLNLGTVHRLRADHAPAVAALRESAQVAGEAGERRLLAWCLKELGHVACAVGAYPAGVRLLSSAESLRLAMCISFKPAGPGELARDRDRARADLGETGLDAAWAAGSALPPAQARAAFLSAAAALSASLSRNSGLNPSAAACSASAPARV